MRNAKLGDVVRTINLTTKYRGLVSNHTADDMTLAGLLRNEARGVSIIEATFGYRTITRVCTECESVEIPDAQWITKCINCYK